MIYTALHNCFSDTVHAAFFSLKKVLITGHTDSHWSGPGLCHSHVPVSLVNITPNTLSMQPGWPHVTPLFSCSIVQSRICCICTITYSLNWTYQVFYITTQLIVMKVASNTVWTQTTMCCRSVDVQRWLMADALESWPVRRLRLPQHRLTGSCKTSLLNFDWWPDAVHLELLKLRQLFPKVVQTKTVRQAA